MTLPAIRQIILQKMPLPTEPLEKGLVMGDGLYSLLMRLGHEGGTVDGIGGRLFQRDRKPGRLGADFSSSTSKTMGWPSPEIHASHPLRCVWLLISFT